MIELERKILVIIVALMAVAMLATPVMAEKPTVTNVKLVQKGTNSLPDKIWMTNGNVTQVRGRVNTGTVELYIPDTAASPAYVFALNNVWDAHVKSVAGQNQVVILIVDAEYIYKVEGVTVGTFEGRIMWNTPDAHGVLQGTGIFEGQTLKFWKDTAVAAPITWVGTLMER